MRTIALLDNVIQPYAWGSTTAIAELLGTRPDPGKPQAELWMGAHPKAPSTVKGEAGRQSLADLIRRFPKEVLGPAVAHRFDNRLPYLFKVLAAAQPLSIQAHPDREQARIGFHRENLAGVPMDAPNRNYKDPNPKPECICALTPFHALVGFLPLADIRSSLDGILAHDAGLAAGIRGWKHLSGPDGLKRFFNWLCTRPPDEIQRLIRAAVAHAVPLLESDPRSRWVVALAKDYPVDPGVLAPYFLNLVRLAPGQALYLGAGELHAYLEGVGIEIMANSDNVLRCGLTPKHVDPAELQRVLNFQERRIRVLSPRRVGPAEGVYDTPADAFVLSVVQVRDDAVYRSGDDRSIEILLCTSGFARIETPGRPGTLALPKGASAMVPAAAPAYTVHGNATVYKAAVPV